MLTPNRLPRRIGLLCLLVTLAALLVVPRLAAAEDLSPADTSLKFMPDSMAFYCSSLRLGEQVKIVAKSRAWKKLTELPAVQMGLGVYQMQAAMPDTIPAKIQGLLHDEQWKSTRKVLGDMFAHEVFFSADKDLVPLVSLLQEIQTATQYGPALAKLSDPTLEAAPNKVQAKLIFATLLEHLKAIKIPTVLVGFRLSNTQRAAEELKRWENQARSAFEACSAKNKGRMEQTKLGKYEYFTYSVDGKAVPWDQMPLENFREMEENSGDVDKLVNQLKQLKLVVAVGLRDNYLLVSIGSSTDALAKLGEGKLLADRPELKPLGKFADRCLTGISYLSAEFMGVVANPQNSINSVLQAAEQVIAASKLSPSQQSQISKDAAKLAEDLEQLLPEPAALSSFQFMTEHGSESYGYTWGEQAQLDGSKPLGLLQHIGGAPLAAIVIRGKASPQGYEFLTKWLPVALKYVEEFAVPNVEEEHREELKQLVALLRKEGVRLDQINRTLLFPALADGQSGLVLDDQLRSKQYFPQMPASDKPLPMIEPAVVIGVSDAHKLRQAVAEYAEVTQEYLTSLRKIFGNKMPEVQIPQPKKTQIAAGELFAYPLPKEWGVDEQIVPNAGLSEHVAVLALNRKQSERLLTPTPLKIDPLLSKDGQPLAGAGYCHCAAITEMLTPWIDYAAPLIVANISGLEDNPGQVKYAMDQIHTLLEVIKVFKSTSSEIYLENKAVVQHSRIELEDVK